MFQCNDNISGSPSFTLSVAKQEDGTYKATCVSRPEIPAVTAATEVDAIQAIKRVVERFVVANGK